MRKRRRTDAGKRDSGGQLRVIGGRWRGRKLSFPDVDGLRPSSDRVRETLFNWLQPIIEGARCLDLFSGSGALGLEALSRGAAEVVFVDSSPRAVASLRGHLQLLEADNGTVVQEDSLAYLRGDHQAFDVVFLDPPFRQGLLEPCCRLLDSGAWVVPGGRVYLEAERELGEPVLPAGWEMLRAKQAGQVGYYLAKVS